MSDFSTHDTILPLFSAMNDAPRKRYRTLVADPPWHYDLRASDKTHRARVTYGTMSAEELRNLPVGLWAMDDAHLYLWTTNAHMPQAHQLVKAWGFEYKTMITWLKGRLDHGRLVEHMGAGDYYRGSTEHILFATRGRLAVKEHNRTTCFIAPRSEHSEKPAAFYDIVGSMSHGPFLDVFARKQRFIGGHEFEVMDAFGNEVFNPPELLATLTPEQAEGLVGG